MSDIDFREYFYYDETSPSCLRWKESTYIGRYGTVITKPGGVSAGCLSQNGYWKLSLKGRTVLAHRIICSMFWLDTSGGKQVDHINRDRGDNKISNLRVVSSKVNMRNRRKNITNYTGVPGVQFSTTMGIDYACATWRDIDGRAHKRSFSFKRYGLLPAIKMAICLRRKAIEELNTQGAGYSALHGT